MADDLQQRLSVASQCLLQSPPGEVDDVFSDVRALVADDQAFESGILPALQQYNTEQLIVAELEGSQVLITEVSKVKGAEEERHVDPRGQRTFLFDHMKVAASDPQPLAVDEETEAIRSGLDKVLAAHVTNHYSEGASAVYALEDPNYPEPEPEAEPEAKEQPEPEPVAVAEPKSQSEAVEATPADEEGAEEKLEKEEPAADAEVEGDGEEKVAETEAEAETKPSPSPSPSPMKEDTTPLPTSATPPRPSRIFGLYFVGTKYNPSNYWTGKWRSVYVADLVKGTLEGTARVNVHYYEQGNVQLSTHLTSSQPLPSSSSSPSPESLIALIKSSEQSFASQLSSAYHTLSEEQFKSLRRALPRTRTKVDWAKISAYKLSRELGVGGAAAAGEEE